MKKQMNRLVSLGIAGAMAVTMLAGCGSSSSSSSSASSSDSSAAATTAAASSDSSAAATSAAASDGAAAGGADVSGSKIGVLVADVSGEEALGFRDYYENYIANQYGVTFTYTDELSDAASEKAAIEKFAAQGYNAVISLSSNDRSQQIETCEENQIYYAVASGMLDDDQ